MLRKMLRAKIHRATVTAADLEYEGSLTIPPELLAQSGIKDYEAISVWNVTQGTRFETYAITGKAGSNDICVNGAAAHLANPGDKIIIASFADFSEEELVDFKPTLVFVDENNQALERNSEVPGPETYSSTLHT